MALVFKNSVQLTGGGFIIHYWSTIVYHPIPFIGQRLSLPPPLSLLGVLNQVFLIFYLWFDTYAEISVLLSDLMSDSPRGVDW